MKDQGNIRYYQRNDTNHKEVIYLTKDKISLARELAQKDYDEKVLRAVNKELSAIEKYMYLCPEISAKQIYERLHKGRQILVTPIQPSDEEYLRSWEAVKKINCYMQNGYFPGEQVIFTYETKQTPISQRLIKELIYRYCC